MSAWRARIGLIQPTGRGKVFGWWYDRRPEGVEIVPAFIGFRRANHETFDASIDRYAELATELVEMGCTLIVVSGSPPFLLKGPEFEQEWRSQLTARLGVPIIMPIEPHVLALRALGVSKAACANYFGDELNNATVRYFSYYDIEIIPFPGYTEPDKSADDLFSTSLAAIDDVAYGQVYQYCRNGLRTLKTPVDALYINGAGWDAVPAIDYLEGDLGIKVVYTQAALLWLAYHKLSIANPVSDCGLLLRELHEPEH